MFSDLQPLMYSVLLLFSVFWVMIAPLYRISLISIKYAVFFPHVY